MTQHVGYTVKLNEKIYEHSYSVEKSFLVSCYKGSFMFPKLFSVQYKDSNKSFTLLQIPFLKC